MRLTIILSLLMLSLNLKAQLLGYPEDLLIQDFSSSEDTRDEDGGCLQCIPELGTWNNIDCNHIGAGSFHLNEYFLGILYKKETSDDYSLFPDRQRQDVDFFGRPYIRIQNRDTDQILKMNVDETIHLKFRDRGCTDYTYNIVRFFAQEGSNSIPEVVKTGSFRDEKEHEFIFDKPGRYLIHASIGINRSGAGQYCGKQNRTASAWICVTPVVKFNEKDNFPEKTFSACYVGSEQ